MKNDKQSTHSFISEIIKTEQLFGSYCNGSLVSLQLKYRCPIIDKITGKEKFCTDLIEGYLGEWRKGLAIFKCNYCQFLIDEDLFIVKCTKKDFLNADLKPNNGIYRIFGGYYVFASWKRQVMATYPGTDRETLYNDYYSIDSILDENGKLLNDDDRKRILTT